MGTAVSLFPDHYSASVPLIHVRAEGTAQTESGALQASFASSSPRIYLTSSLFTGKSQGSVLLNRIKENTEKDMVITPW